MIQFLAVASTVAALGIGVALWRFAALRGRTQDRLWEGAEEAEVSSGSGLPEPRRITKIFPARWRWLPWLLAVLVGAVVVVFFDWTLLYGATTAIMVGLLGSQTEEYVATRRSALIERQLADAVDLMVGALGAGTGVVAAMETAARESPNPLRSQLDEVLARIRFGDDPKQVFRALSDRVPLETFLLLSSTLAVQWEVGGSLAPTLASIARTIRDRVEVSRRLQSSIVQSQISTITVLGLTYLIAAIVWKSNPSQMSQFLASSSGRWLVAATMLLQALGMVWMSRISRLKF